MRDFSKDKNVSKTKQNERMLSIRIYRCSDILSFMKTSFCILKYGFGSVKLFQHAGTVIHNVLTIRALVSTTHTNMPKRRLKKWTKVIPTYNNGTECVIQPAGTS
jgi:hypothetical protein